METPHYFPHENTKDLDAEGSPKFGRTSQAGLWRQPVAEGPRGIFMVETHVDD